MSEEILIPRKEMLDLNEVAYFLLPEQEHDFVRIGNPGDGACFFYSFLQSYCGVNFIGKTYKDSQNIVAEFRKKVGAFFTLDAFKNFKVQDVHSTVFQKYFNNAFKLYRKKDTEKLYNVLAANDRLFQEMSVEDIKSAIGEPLATLYETIISRAYELFKTTIQSYREYADEPEIGIISEIFNVNILVLDMDGFLRRSLVDASSNVKPFIIVYYMNNNHYESIGINKKGPAGNNKIVCLFDAKDQDILNLIERTKKTS